MTVYRGIFLLFLSIMLGAGATGRSVEAKFSVEEAGQNVFRILAVGRCEDREYGIKSATCFLIGNISREQNQYILTTKHVLAVSEEEKEQIRKDNQLNKDAELEIFYRVVVSDDIALEASVYNQAQSDDYAILQLGSSLADRRGIPLGDMEQVKDDIPLYVLGYDAAEFKVNTYTSTLDNRNSDTEKLTYSNSSMQGSDLGAPVLDEKGSLLGIHVGADDNAGHAVAVNKLRSSFQTLNVTYENSDSKYDVLKEKILEGKEKVKKDDVYTSSSLQELSRVLEQAETVFENPESGNVEYENQIHALDTAIEDLSEKGAGNKIIMLVLALLILGVGILTLVVFLRGRRKKNVISFIDGTTKAAGTGRASETGTPANAYLLSKPGGEKISVTKDRFIIGSQSGAADYVIFGQKSVSRRHAEITVQNGGFYIRDLNSTNHTYVNGQMVEKNTRKRIRNADTIRFANIEYTFVAK